MVPELELVEKRIIDLENHDWKILVLKGVSNQTYQIVARKFQQAEPADIFHQDGKIGLLTLKQSIPALIGKMFATGNNDRMIMLFETFCFLAKNLNIEILPFKIILIANNLLEYYPKNSDLIVPDFEEIEDFNETGAEAEIVSELYSSSLTINGKQYIQYIDGFKDQNKNLSYINLLETDEMPEVVEMTPTQIPKEAISFKDDDLRIQILIEEWLNETPPESITFLVDKSILVNEESKQHLKVLYGFFKLINSPVLFVKLDNRLVNETRTELFSILNKYWQSQNFRDLEFYKDPDITKELLLISQGEIIECVVRECEKALSSEVDFRDVFLTAPTGAGKSLLFQLPAIFLAQKFNAITIVISPLIALMKDQVFALKEKGYQNVVCLNSELSLIEREEELEKVKRGDTHIIYLSPELLLSYDISMFIGERKIGLLVIDEAHLVTTWGRDFRVDYWYIGHFIRKIRKYSLHRFPVLAVTATAVYDSSGLNDMVFETLDSLSMNNAIKYIGKVRRDDIGFVVNNPTVEGGHEQFKIKLTGDRINKFCNEEKKTIVYCPWTSQINPIRGRVEPAQKDKVQIYYGQLDPVSKESAYNEFKAGNALVMIATKAFGMGVDIDDIAVVYHHAPSGHLADYIQEIGRAARKKDLAGTAAIDFTNRDLKYTKILFGLSSIKQYQVSMVLDKLSKIYNYKKTRNLLVTINDFEYIFNIDNIDVEQKVKSALLLLEKDLLAKYKYNVLIVRPKSLFTTGFVAVSETESLAFQDKYGDYLKSINNSKKESKGLKVYVIALDRLWESKHINESFPMIKRKFFDGTLFQNDFPKYFPQLRINYTINSNAQEIFEKITETFKVIEEAFSGFDGFFTKQNLIDVLKPKLGNIMSKRIADLILSIYSDPGHNEMGLHRHIPDDCFLQSRRKDHEYTYRIIKKSYQKVMSATRNTFFKIFSLTDSLREQTIFIPADSVKTDGKKYIRQAYVIETFNLGTYEISGGETPAIFIRINDPLKIDRLAKSNYNNNILTGIRRRFETSSKIMQFFFTKSLTDKERWDFIEDYFLGKLPDELVG